MSTFRPSVRMIVLLLGTGLLAPLLHGTSAIPATASHPTHTRIGTHLMTSDAPSARSIEHGKDHGGVSATAGSGTCVRSNASTAREANQFDDAGSSAILIGAPEFRYRDSLESAAYSAFAADNAERTRMAYTMNSLLRGFDAETGAKVLEFNTAVGTPLQSPTSRTAAGKDNVRKPLSYGDAFVRGAWRTVLVAGMSNDTQGIYALDVTTPTPGGLLNLWQFTDADDSDLGDAHGQPTIVKLNNGRWAAVFGNGYNSMEVDSFRSSTGSAVLYLVDLADGSLIRKFDTGAGINNGLASPAVIDLNNDKLFDFAFAGDLHGNLWKFDLTSANQNEWHIVSAASSKPSPLFQARDANGNSQPITTRPAVARDPAGQGIMVFFGTGIPDGLATNSSSAVAREQTFYGIADKNRVNIGDRIVDRNELERQVIINEADVTAPGGSEIQVRVTSHKKTNSSRGWYIDLQSPTRGNQAERQVGHPEIRGKSVIFTTVISDSSSCAYLGTSWFMKMTLDGSPAESEPFDLNNDGDFTRDDRVTEVVNGEDVQQSVSGVASTVGILDSPGITAWETEGNQRVQYRYLHGDNGAVQRIRENPSDVGRQSWRQTH